MKCVSSISVDPKQTRAIVVGTHVDLIEHEELEMIKIRVKQLIEECNSQFVCATTFLSVLDESDVIRQLERGIQLAAQQAALINREVETKKNITFCWLISRLTKKKEKKKKKKKKKK
jgi:hypothetical protein